MGRPAKHREPVERAAHDLLAGGRAMQQRELFAEIRRLARAPDGTHPSDGTIRKWLQPLCNKPAKRGRPGDAGAAWWWSLASEITGTDPNIAAIEPKITRTGDGIDTSAPKMTATRGRAHDQPGTRSLHAQHRVRGHAPEIAGTGGPLLDADQRSGAEHQHDRADERTVAIRAFGECLANWGWALSAITITAKNGHMQRGAVVGLAAWVAARGGGLWFVPHKRDTAEEHHHGVLAHERGGPVIDAWTGMLGGAATLDGQRVEPVHDLPGWLGYCRREPGFDLAHVIVSGWLRDPWTWALGRAGHMPPEPRGLASLPRLTG